MSSSSILSTFMVKGRKIIAMGRNFADHAKELGNPVPKNPFFFLKPTSSYCLLGHDLLIPDNAHVHHEVELAVIIKKKAFLVSELHAMNYVAGYALAIDLTARHIQNQAKIDGLPWTVSKGFDNFTPITNAIPIDAIHDPHNLRIALKVNGQLRQDGNTQDFVFKIPYLISYVSQIMTLEPGDVLLTGTPKGVGPIQAQDVIEIHMESESKQVLYGQWEVKTRPLMITV